VNKIEGEKEEYRGDGEAHPPQSTGDEAGK
jgi:hypothetical protein